MTDTLNTLCTQRRELPAGIFAERYHLVKQLGAGSYGDVWLAHDQRAAGQAVAVKLLKEPLRSQHSHHSFDRECSALTLLRDHPHIVSLYEYGQCQGRAYIVMEYISGQSLASWLDEHRAQGAQGRVPEQMQVYALFDQICAAIASAHDIRDPGPIVHRDIKPTNVMLARDGYGRYTAKVLDFGVARLGPRKTTMSLERVGTQGYMPPEQLNGHHEQLRPWSDVFSLALLLVEMLTLQTEDIRGVPLCILATQHPQRVQSTLRRLRRDVPMGVWRVAARALRPQGSARYQDAGALRAALRCATQSSGTPGRRTHLAASLVEAALLRLRLRWHTLLVLALTAWCLQVLQKWRPAPQHPPPGGVMLVSRWVDYFAVADMHRSLCAQLRLHNPENRCQWVPLWSGGTDRVLSWAGAPEVLTAALDSDGSVRLSAQGSLLFPIGDLHPTPAWKAPAHRHAIIAYLAHVLNGVATLFTYKIANAPDWTEGQGVPVLAPEVVGRDAVILGALLRYMQQGSQLPDGAGLNDAELQLLGQSVQQCRAIHGSQPWYCLTGSFLYVVRCPLCSDAPRVLHWLRTGKQIPPRLQRRAELRMAESLCLQDPLKAALLLTQMPDSRPPYSCKHLDFVGPASCTLFALKSMNLDSSATPQLAELAALGPERLPDCAQLALSVAVGRRAHYLMRAKQWEEAEQDLAYVRQVDTDPNYLLDQAECLLHLGQREQVMDLLNDQSDVALLVDRPKLIAVFYRWLASRSHEDAGALWQLYAQRSDGEVVIRDIGKTMAPLACPTAKDQRCIVYKILTGTKLAWSSGKLRAAMRLPQTD